MDEITASGATKSGKTIEVAGLKLTERATIDIGLLDLLRRPYREETISRDTLYMFKAGRPVFMLKAPDGLALRDAVLRSDHRQDLDL
jgi:hypothetical protein